MARRYSITDPYSLRAICIRKHWFTSGTNEQYEKLFYANQNGYTLDEIATIIWVCSDVENRQEIVDVLSDIQEAYLMALAEEQIAAGERDADEVYCGYFD